MAVFPIPKHLIFFSIVNHQEAAFTTDFYSLQIRMNRRENSRCTITFNILYHNR